MKIKSALVTQISGSIGGMTGSRNGGGMYFRARSIPTNPNTAFQQTVRESFGALSNAWGLLTPTQRDDWNVYAQNVPLPDRLGDQRLVSGMNHYMRSNAPRLSAGLAIVSDAPTDFNIGPTPLISAGTIGNDGSIDGEALPQSPGIAGTILLYVSRPQSPTINYFRGPYQFVTAIDFASPGTASVALTSESPFSQTIGQRVYIRVQTSLDDGRLSADAQDFAVVTAP